MNILAAQRALVSAGFPLTPDGLAGPMTYAALLGYASQRSLGQLGQALGVGMAAAFPGAGIGSDLSVIHWCAQASHETEGFRYLTELGGPDYFKRYEGNKDLGNTQPGDGYNYRGRGIFQITGRWNYAHFGAEVGEPLEANPGLAAQPGIAVKVACQFWLERHIGPLAEANDIQGVTRKINGGLNGLADRLAVTNRLLGLFGVHLLSDNA